MTARPTCLKCGRPLTKLPAYLAALRPDRAFQCQECFYPPVETPTARPSVRAQASRIEDPDSGPEGPPEQEQLEEEEAA